MTPRACCLVVTCILAGTGATFVQGGRPARADAGSKSAARKATAKADEATVAPYARLWLGVSGAVDFAVMPAGSDVCRLTPELTPDNSEHYYCTNPSGSDFPSAAQNAHLSAPGSAGAVSQGLRVGDARVMLALDYAALGNVLLGVRLGYVLNGYGGAAAVRDGRALGPKVHAELRVTYVFGRDPLSHEGFAPTAFIGGGISEFDVHTSTLVTLDNVAGAQSAGVWLTDAPFFITLGGGARYQFSPRLQLTLGARFNAAFHDNGILPTFGPEVTVQAGF